MICLDTFSGYMHVYIMNDKSHTTIQRYLNELILSYKENNHSIEYAVSDSENTFMACNMTLATKYLIEELIIIWHHSCGASKWQQGRNWYTFL